MFRPFLGNGREVADMSAIWGAIDTRGNAIPKQIQKIFRESYEQCVIDRYEERQFDHVYMGCGIQYFVPEAEKEKGPICKDDCCFTADVVLDNRQELLDKLGISQIDGSQMADGDILYEMYDRYGKECLNDLLGAYSFVYYDRKNNRIEFVLDAVGNRCLYYRIMDGIFYFSSLMEPLAEISEQTKLNDRWITDFLAMDHLFMINETEETPFLDINRIAPAQYISYDGKELVKELYWKPFENYREMKLSSDAAYQKSFCEIWDKAVKDVIRTDSEVSIMLSGGLDSTAVAAVAAPYLKEKGKKLFSYTSVPMRGYQPTDNGYDVDDESEDVKKTAEYYGNIVTDFIDLDGKTPWELVDEEFHSVEMPFKSIQNCLWIEEAYKRAYSNGSRLILNGSYGNTSISFTDLNVYMNTLFGQKKYGKLRKEIKAFSKSMGFSVSYAMKQIYQDCKAQYEINPYPYRFSFVRRNMTESLNTRSRMEEMQRNQNESSKNFSVFRKQMVLWIALRQIGEIETKHSLATGVLLRDPTKDKRVIDFCIHLPIEQFCRDGVDRRLVKVYLKDKLPPHVFSYSRKGKQSADLRYRFEKNWNRIRNEWIALYEEYDGSVYVDTVFARRQLLEEPDITKYSSFDLTRHMYTLLILRYEAYIANKYPAENQRKYQKEDLPDNELISVIIPVYNTVEYLSDCVHSVCRQTYKNLEIILVDDGSTDGSGKLCDQLAGEDTRIVVVHQQNGGVSAARNAGLRYAHGRYVGFVDSDDRIDEDMYNKLYQLLTENHADVSCCKYRQIFDGDKVRDSSDNRVRVYYGSEMMDTWKTGHERCQLSSAVTNKLYKMELFDNLEFPDIRKYEDGFVNAELLAKIRKGVFINRAYYNYVKRETSLANEKSDFKDISDFIRSNTIQNNIAENMLCGKSTRHMYFNYYCNLLDLYCKTFRQQKTGQSRKMMVGEIHRIQNVVRAAIDDNIQRGIKKNMHLKLGTYSPLLYYTVRKLLR